MLYDVGELDDCQIALFILGRAGTGKSTILNKMIGEFYDPDDVGVLSNNIEAKFGLGSIYDNTIIIGPELKKDIQMSQTDMQSAISGENMQIAIKNKPSVKVKWSAPMAFAGNNIPNWSDNSGSVSRRICVLEFEKLVKVGDGELPKRLQQIIPYMLLKGNRGYLQHIKIARKTGINDIWKYLPKYWHDNKLKISTKTQGCLHFILNKLVTGNQQKRIKLDDFVSSLNEHLKLYGFAKQVFDKEFYMAPFESYNLTIEEDRSKKSKHKYVYGAEYVSDAATEETALV